MTSTPSRRRKPKLDPQLAEESARAKEALAEIAQPEEIGEYVGAAADDDRLVTHRFQCLLPGYKGRTWFATVARAPRTKMVTVCELGLVSGEESLLAPPWVPWSERVSAEEKKAAEEGLDEAEEAAEEEATDAPAETDPAAADTEED